MYFIAVVSKIFEFPANIVTEIGLIVRNEYSSFRSNRFINIHVEDLIIASMMFVYAQNDIKLDVQKIDEFMQRIFLTIKIVRGVKP